jgi:methyl-accepting chemotaxis protein
MSIRMKLFVVVGLLVVPLTLMSWLFVAQSQKDISFAAAEREGTLWLKSMWPGLIAFAQSPEAVPDRPMAEAARALSSTDLPAAVREAAGSLTTSGKTSAEIAAAYRDAATAVGNESNLILDPDLDSFYVMDTVVVRLPDLMGRAAVLETMARRQSKLEQLDDDTKAAFVIELGQISGAMDTIRASIKTALANNTDGSVERSLKAQTDAFGETVKRFSDAAMATAHELRDEKTRKTTSFADLEATRLDLVRSGDSYWNAANSELDHLLEVRIGGFEMRLWTMLGIAIAVAALAVGVALYLSRGIVASIASLDRRIRELGDADINAEIAEAAGTDEIALLAKAVVYFRDRTIEKLEEANSEERRREIVAGEKAALQGVAERVQTTMHGVVAAINELARGINSAIGTISDNASGTRDELDASLGRLNAASADMNLVVAAVTQLSASIAEISRQTESSARDMESASQRAELARSVGERLNGTSERIGEVLTIISTIAEQTHLLALNATIEAARAGEAGRGFAVVASEVKELANQTAKATEEIKSQVNGIREAAREVMSSLTDITGSIATISTLSTSIAGAVDEQSGATSEITSSIDRSARSTGEVVAGLNRLPTMASKTEEAANRLSGLSHSLFDQVHGLEREVDSLLRDLTDQRRFPRFKSTVVIEIEIAGRRIEGQLYDISRGGLRVSTREACSPKSPCRLILPNIGSVNGTVAWHSEGLAGIQFLDHNLSDHQLDAMLGTRAAA